jgi:hypothetical protein
VFHDIGLWTDHTLSYLEPSSLRAKATFGDIFNDDELELLFNLIYYHHKFTAFEGPHADIVNAFLKADWIDATSGAIRRGMPKSHVKKVKAALPDDDFQKVLAGFGPRLHGMNVFNMIKDISKIYKW